MTNRWSAASGADAERGQRDESDPGVPEWAAMRTDRSE